MSGRLMERNLLAIELQNEPFAVQRVNDLIKSASRLPGMSPEILKYYVFTGNVTNLALAPDAPEIKILVKSGKTEDLKNVSDMFDQSFLSERVIKYFLCYPKECR
jgi:hypothetical protein